MKLHQTCAAGALGLCLVIAPPRAHAVSINIVISQIYGGGGNSGATLTNDYIELFNRGATSQLLAGWSVQYASDVGSVWQVTNLPPVTLAPGQYFLIQEAAGAGGTTALPTPDVIGTISMSATNGKVALANSTAALICALNCTLDSRVVDLVGYGSTASSFEGSGSTPTLSNTTAAIRLGDGAQDTDDNAADFVVGAPNPRNSNSSLDIPAVPMPAALPLFATGLGALGLLGWWRKRRSTASTA
jgi:predicted extracellular nuclease